MAALPHTNGGYRAYKKIDGIEHQVYCHSQKEADKAQLILEEKYRFHFSLAPEKVFSGCGRLRGYRMGQERRKGRKPAIFWRRQLQKRKGVPHKQVLYHGEFEALWKEIKKDWALINELMPADLAGYKKELKHAKRLYIQDISKLEEYTATKT